MLIWGRECLNFMSWKFDVLARGTVYVNVDAISIAVL